MKNIVFDNKIIYYKENWFAFFQSPTFWLKKKTTD